MGFTNAKKLGQPKTFQYSGRSFRSECKIFTQPLFPSNQPARPPTLGGGHLLAQGTFHLTPIDAGLNERLVIPENKTMTLLISTFFT